METHKIRVYGIVQGVGFRPFVSRTCLENGINGTVANKGSYVEIFAQGNVPVLLDALRHNPPDRAIILDIIDKQVEKTPFKTFEIIEGERDEGAIFVSPDIAICEDCKRELFDKSNRRYMHPFINCTNCGPRLTILDSMPYDRVRTSMKDFEMCPECEYEYTHPETRRFDAQPVCCPNCGPVVYGFDPKIVDVDTITLALKKREAYASDDSFVKKGIQVGNSSITTARKAIIDGKILAIKGIGGYHLCCDAKNEEAVARLRLLKNRPMKPFAVMMRDMDAVQRECVLIDKSDEMDSWKDKEKLVVDLLTGHQKPIVLLEKRNDTTLARSVAPDNPKLGIMLPYTPIHLLLFDYEDELTVPDCLIMTSANASGAPICRTDEDAISEIADFTDMVLSNNRMIRTRADDTVTNIYDGQPYMIRRSRGFAPLPVMLNSDEAKGSVLAIGGELKNTFCVAKDSLLYASAYVGDMADIRTVNALKESVDRMMNLLETRPSLIVTDLHPKYNTVEVAEEMGRDLGVPVMKIQHHYAHILACMAENDYLDEVIGVSFDGTGYGTDGTIWGGEYLRCNLAGFERLGNITPFLQCGGDLSSKEGWRIAASILGGFMQSPSSEVEGAYDLLSAEEIVNSLGLCNKLEYEMLLNMARTGINSILSTSAGRLFDGVSAILGIRRSSTFEGEASTALMFAAERYLRRENAGKILKSMLRSETVRNDSTDTNQLVIDIAKDFLSGRDRDELAFIFHARLADIIAKNSARFSKDTGIKTVALSGGVFQNTLLLSMVEKRLKSEGIKVLRHSQVPPNDGGICVGQALAGLMSSQVKDLM